LQAAAREKRHAGENRAVEHVALDDDAEQDGAVKTSPRKTRQQQKMKDVKSIY